MGKCNNPWESLYLTGAPAQGVVCALREFVFVYGYYHPPWVYKGLDSWYTARKCLLGYPSVPAALHRWTAPLDLHHWVGRRTELERNHWYSWRGFTSFNRAHPSLGRSRGTSESDQKPFLNSGRYGRIQCQDKSCATKILRQTLAKAVLNGRVVLNYP